VSDALIVGDGNAVKPDDAITGAQLVTILCRVFSPGKTADLSGVTD